MDSNTQVLPLPTDAASGPVRRWSLVGIAAILLGIAQAWRLWRITDLYAVDVPFFDQWDFYALFFRDKAGIWGLFNLQHGPHRQGLGFLLTWFVNWLTDWNQRSQCFAICLVAFASAAAALWLCRRLTGRLRWYDVAVVMIVLSPQQWEVIANTPNVSHGVMPLLLILLCCVGWTITRPVLRYAVVLTLTFLCTYTGFGLFLGIVTPTLIGLDLVQAKRRRDRRALLLCAGALGLAICSLLLFFHGYRFAPAAPNYQFPDPNWPLYPVFMGLQYATLYGATQIGDPPHTGNPQVIFGCTVMAIIIAIAVVLLWQELRSKEARLVRRIALLLIAFSLAFSASSAIGRVSLGLVYATNSRYVPLLMPAAIGVYLLAAGLQRPVWRRVAMAMVLLAAAAATVPYDSTGAAWFRDSKVRWVTAYHLTGSVKTADGVAPLSVYPNRRVTHLAWKLTWLRKRHYSLFREGAAERRIIAPTAATKPGQGQGTAP